MTIDIAAAAPKTTYAASQKVLHWSLAVLILLAAGIGTWCAFQAPGTEPRKSLLDIHKAIGLTAVWLVALRVVVRARLGEPPYAVAPGALAHAAARAVHAALYGAMVIMPVSGYVYSCAGGYGLPWFGLFTWPRLLARDEALSHAGYLIHHYVGWALWALLAVHVAAVVWHRLRRDEVLGRML